MPLKEFIDEVIEQLENDNNVDEIKVKRVEFFANTVNIEEYGTKFTILNG